MLSVSEAAIELGVSEPRVRQLIATGKIQAERIAGRWVIDLSSLPARGHAPGRPMSTRIAWALLLHSGDPSMAHWLRSDEASRLRRRIAELSHSPDPLARVRSWLAARARSHHLHAQDPSMLLADDRVVPSGISAARSGLSSAGEAEAYVHEVELDGVVLDHLLVDAPPSRANVLLHSSEFMPTEPVPDLLVVADLADRGGPREYARAEEILDDWLVSAAGVKQT